jgi:hypothetical protein
MTDTERLQKEKLQKLFQAALHDASTDKVTLARAYPKTTLDTLAAQAATPSAPLIPAQPEPGAMVPAQSVAPAATSTDFVQPLENAGLDASSAEELRILLEGQHLRLKHKRRRETIGALAVFLVLTCGGFGWFVHSPDRVQAFRDAVKEVRSAGDIAGMVAKYQKALDKIGTRSKDIDAATESMGVSADQTAMKDVYMDAEMKQMMGGEGGKTIGERNKMLREKFGSVKTGGLKASVASGAAAPKPVQAPAPPKSDQSLSLKY